MNIFSIDVEDWYQGIEIPVSQWDQFECRVNSSMNRMLDLMEKHDVQATCFILGKVAEEHPALVKKIHNLGHEIATHGYSHTKVYELTPEKFQRELRHSIKLLEDLTGEKIIGHRAPYFSITENSLWALDILAEEGILYDSSIHPVLNYRYGIPDAERTASKIDLQSGKELLEIPVSTFPTKIMNIPVGGGAYMRLYPYTILNYFLKKIENREERISFYMHPWEIDFDQPQLDLPLIVKFTHYYNLKSTQRKLDSLFGDFNFRPYKEVYSMELSNLSA